jgi:hypothetical protein
MSTSIQLYDQPKSIASVSEQRNAIAQMMATVMKKDIDYGTIPGTPKPTLYKPGSEKLLSMFHLTAKPIVDDLSTPDCMRFRVFVQITEMGTGRYLGEGVGEASSAETKYQWRSIVCEEEFQTTPDDRRRTIWKDKQYGRSVTPFPLKQVRTCMEDIANTVLKMAKKRAQIDAVLTVTAASDVFMQDAQEIIDAGIDLPDEPQQVQPERPATLQPKQPVQPINQAVPQQSRPAPAAPTGVRLISEAQARRFKALGKSAGKEYAEMDAHLLSLGIARAEDIPFSRYEALCNWAEGK